jgi:acyl carrier protein
MEKTKLLQFKQILAEFIGVSVEDIDNDDSFSEDLHMQPSDLSDFVHILEENGFDTKRVDLSKIESVADLTESLELEDNI